MSNPVLRRLRGLFPKSRPAPAVPRPRLTQADQTPPARDEKLKVMFEKVNGKNPRSLRRNGRSFISRILHLAGDKNQSLVEHILMNQKQHIGTSEGFAALLISICGQVGMFHQARKLFDELPDLKCPRTTKSLNALLDAGVQSKQFDEVEEIFNNLPRQLSIDIDSITYNILIKAYCHMGSLDTALSMVDEMREKGFEPSVITYNTLLNGYYKNRQFSEAAKMWDLMESEKNASPNALSYYLKLRTWVSEDKLSEAVEVFADMVSRNIEPNVCCFNALISGFCLAEDVVEVKNWYWKLLKSKCGPSRVTMEMLIPFLLGKGELDMVEKLCIDAIYRNLGVGEVHLQSVVNFLVSESKVESAKKLVHLSSSKSYLGYHLQLP